MSRTSPGHKLRAVSSGPPTPDAFATTPLNRCERQTAARMVKARPGHGYLLAGAGYDASWLFGYCHHHGHQMVCPRAKPGTGLGHPYVSPHRERAVEMLEVPAHVNGFGRRPYDRRGDIERDFPQLSGCGGGPTAWPPWVRRIRRVRHRVMTKLLINAARIRLNRKNAGNA